MEEEPVMSENEPLLKQYNRDTNSDGHSIQSIPESFTNDRETSSKRKRYGVNNFLPCDPRRWLHRFIMLVFMCFLSFGSYYCYDNPAALTKIFLQVMQVDFSQYNLMYSLYSWPNVILSLVGGVLIDRVFGIRIGTVVFSLFVTLGQLIYALGGIFHYYDLMLAGRFVFGIGGESLAVAQNAYAVLWFKGKELNMVFGLLLSFSRLGSTVNMNTNIKMYNSFTEVSDKQTRLGVVLMIGFGWCLFSLLIAVVLGLFDKRAEKILKRDIGEGEKISLKDIKDFSITLWLVFFVCVFYYVTVFPFIGFASVFLISKYNFPAHEANIVNSLVYLISAVASPIFGLAVDKTGFNLFWMNFGIIATMVCHGLFGFLSSASFIPILAMIGMGLAYSILACALWPLVAFLIDENKLGTAYGIMQSVQNLGLAIVPMIAGRILDKNGYLMLEMFFLVCLSLALICGILLYLIDSTKGGSLNLSAWTRAKMTKIEQEEAEAQKSSVSPGGVADVMGGDVPTALQPSSAFQLRNRLLSRMGTRIPDHVAHVNPLTRSVAHVGILK